VGRENVNFQNFHLLGTGLNVDPLLNSLASHPALWEEITERQTTPGSPHKYTRSIFLRWAKDLTIESVFTDLQAIDYHAFQKLDGARELVDAVLKLAGSSHEHLGRVMIAELAPGGWIHPHSDEGEYADHFERFHLPLQSEPGNTFMVDLLPGCGEYVHMLPGEVWNFNHKRVHTLFNDSDKPRIHLIVDCVAPDFRRERD